MRGMRLTTLLTSAVLAVALAAGPLAATPAAAQSNCGFEGGIVALSDTVLARRGELARLPARNFGAEAAYFKIRYSPLDQREGAALLTALLGENIRFMRDLAFAYFVSTEGADAARAALGDEVMDEAMLTSASAMRAMVLAGAAETLIDAIAASPAERRHVFAQPLYAALLDQPDAVKTRVAARAEAQGLIEIAATLFATHQDGEAWQGFIERLGDPAMAEAVSRQYWMLPLLVGGEPFTGDVEGERLVSRRQFADLFIADALQPELGLLMTFANMTGLLEPTQKVARRIANDTYLFKLPFFGPFDAGWLQAYRGLIAETGDKAMVDGTLSTLSVGKREGRRTTTEVIDWMIAVEALADYVSGASDVPPPAPEAFASAVPAVSFEEWVEVAALVRGSAPPPLFLANETKLAMAAELMLAGGRVDSLVALLADAPTEFGAVALASDMVKRLDRLCEAYGWHTSEAIVLAGMPIFKFPVSAAALPQVAPSPPPGPRAPARRQ